MFSMKPIEFIRKTVFRLSQKDFAAIAKVAQATVSRWESGEFEPTRTEMSNIRLAASERSIPWNDSWFFEVPTEQVAAE